MWSGAFAILVSLGTVCAKLDPKVKSELGAYRGIWTETKRGYEVASFLGIAYAEPPTGDRRFQNPEPLTNAWRRARDAKKYASPCLSALRDDKRSEDCLYLNVFTRQKIQHARRPENDTGAAVIVFLISTSGEFGGNNNSLYNAHYLLDQDVVLVTVNYRLGFFGFFTTGDEAAPGNYGLKDVLVALEWVQKNIAAFGGDPESVTLMGHGEGAGVVHLLALSHRSEGLFHRYITQSGTALSPWSYRPREIASAASMRFATSLKCDRNTTEEVVKCMRDIAADAHVWRPSEISNRWVDYGPTDEPESDDAVITQHPKALMQDGNVNDVPWLAGVVADEGLLQTMDYEKNATLCDGLEKYFEYFIFSQSNHRQIVEDPSAYIQELARYYFDGNFTNCAETLTELIGDLLVYWPVYETVKIQVEKTKSDLYFYNIAYNGTFSTTFVSDPSRFGISHRDDLNYLFPVLNTFFEDLQLKNNEDDDTMINIVTEMWANFARSGVPRALHTLDWDSYQTEQGYLEFDHKVNLSMKKGFLVDRMDFWGNLTEKYFPSPDPNGGAGSMWANSGNVLTIVVLVHLTILAIFVD